jgi:methylglutaconyl-CoA hydratase
LIGVSKAKELIYTARILDGDQAKEYGLVNYSVKQNNEGNAAYKLAIEIAQEISKNVFFNIQSILDLKLYK